MYNDNVLRIPADEADLWKVLQEQFVLVRDALEMPVETREQAFDIEYQSTPQAKLARISGGLIRYRDVSEENNQRDYYLEMGLDLIPYIKDALKERKLTPEFVQQWGKLMFCFGYTVSHIFDDSDDLALMRAGLRRGRQRSKDAQRKWIAHIMIPLIDGGMKRNQAESEVVRHVTAALDNEALRGGFTRDWFEPIITHGDLAATYDAKHFAVKAMRKLLEEPTDDIPPIPEIP